MASSAKQLDSVSSDFGLEMPKGIGAAILEEESSSYRCELARPCIDFSCDEGRQVFREALATEYMEGYFRISEQYRTQDHPRFCGLASMVMVLNALSVDPKRVWKGEWRWYEEEMLLRQESIRKVEERGMEFERLKTLALNNGIAVDAKQCYDGVTVDEFRADVRAVCSTVQDPVMILQYSRPLLNQKGGGHFSPVGGYHPERDLVLIMDVARYKFPPHWVPLTDLFASMQTMDVDAGKPRGWMVLTRSDDLRETVTGFRASSVNIFHEDTNVDVFLQLQTIRRLENQLSTLLNSTASGENAIPEEVRTLYRQPS